MTYLTDGKKAIEITMIEDGGEDRSGFFFAVETLPKFECGEKIIRVVPDVGCYVRLAKIWEDDGNAYSVDRKVKYTYLNDECFVKNIALRRDMRFSGATEEKRVRYWYGLMKDFLAIYRDVEVWYSPITKTIFICCPDLSIRSCARMNGFNIALRYNKSNFPGITTFREDLNITTMLLEEAQNYE